MKFRSKTFIIYMIFILQVSHIRIPKYTFYFSQKFRSFHHSWNSILFSTTYISNMKIRKQVFFFKMQLNFLHNLHKTRTLSRYLTFGNDTEIGKMLQKREIFLIQFMNLIHSLYAKINKTISHRWTTPEKINCHLKRN